LGIAGTHCRSLLTIEVHVDLLARGMVDMANVVSADDAEAYINKAEQEVWQRGMKAKRG